MKLFRCQHCLQLLYFENYKCEKCGHSLGYIAEAETLSALEPEGDNWRALAFKNKLYRFCSNAQFNVCNWLIEALSPEIFCAACRHNRTVPDTSIPENLVAWQKIEIAAHRLFYTLMKLKLPLDHGFNDDRERLAFDFLATSLDAVTPKVLTGHEHGLITVALEEADDHDQKATYLRKGGALIELIGTDTTVLWFLLPMAAAMQLSAVTAHITSNIAAAKICGAETSTGAGCTIIAACTPPKPPRSSIRIFPPPPSSAGVPSTRTDRPRSLARPARAVAAPTKTDNGL